MTALDLALFAMALAGVVQGVRLHCTAVRFFASVRGAEHMLVDRRPPFRVAEAGIVLSLLYLFLNAEWVLRGLGAGLPGEVSVRWSLWELGALAFVVAVETLGREVLKRRMRLAKADRYPCLTLDAAGCLWLDSKHEGGRDART